MPTSRTKYKHPARWHLHVLGIRARKVQSEHPNAGRRRNRGKLVVLFVLRVVAHRHYAVTNFKADYPFAQFGHLTGGVGAQDVGEG